MLQHRCTERAVLNSIFSGAASQRWARRADEPFTGTAQLRHCRGCDLPGAACHMHAACIDSLGSDAVAVSLPTWPAYSPNSLRLRCVQRLLAATDRRHLKAVTPAVAAAAGNRMHANTRFTTLQGTVQTTSRPASTASGSRDQHRWSTPFVLRFIRAWCTRVLPSSCCDRCAAAALLLLCCCCTTHAPEVCGAHEVGAAAADGLPPQHQVRQQRCQ